MLLINTFLSVSVRAGMNFYRPQQNVCDRRCMTKLLVTCHLPVHTVSTRGTYVQIYGIYMFVRWYIGPNMHVCDSRCVAKSLNACYQLPDVCVWLFKLKSFNNWIYKETYKKYSNSIVCVWCFSISECRIICYMLLNVVCVHNFSKI
jgi:hypothetical protein